MYLPGTGIGVGGGKWPHWGAFEDAVEDGFHGGDTATDDDE